MSPRPVSELPAERCRLLLFDIDGTVTEDETRIPSRVFRTLESMRAAGIPCIPVTGRPGGWCDMIARTWPVEGVVGENGGLAFRLTRDEDGQRSMERRFRPDQAARSAARSKLDELARRILEEVPGAALASDQSYRDLDLAVDFREDVPELPPDRIRRIEELFAESGATYKVSSIHVNGWFGDWDKLGMCVDVARSWLGLELDGADRETVVFVGDSPNDEPMFREFPLGCGVANIRRFLPDLTHPPAYVAEGSEAEGFVEICDHILAVRPSPA